MKKSKESDQEQIDPAEFESAKKAASMFMAQMVAMHPRVQLMTVDMMLKAAFLSNVKDQHRLALFDRYVKAIRGQILAATREVPTNGKA